MPEYKPSVKLDTRKIQGYDISLKYLSEENSTIPSWSGKVHYSLYGLEISLSSLYAKFIFIYYIPTSMFTITSWVSFIIPPSSYPARFKCYSSCPVSDCIIVSLGQHFWWQYFFVRLGSSQLHWETLQIVIKGALVLRFLDCIHWISLLQEWQI